MRLRPSANDGGQPPNDGSRAANVVIPGQPQVLLAPTAPVVLFPEGCAGGHRQLGELTPSART